VALGHLARQGLRSAASKSSRLLLRSALAFAGEPARIRAERRWRGRQQLARLREADVAIVSYGKAGRTWLRVMLLRLYQRRHELPELAITGLERLDELDARIPRLFFTHDNYIRDYTGHHDTKPEFYGMPVVFLARDPRDVAVSQYFQWKYRMKPQKKKINNYPPHGAEVTPFEFVMNDDVGLPRIIEFMNLWARESVGVRAFLLVRYEDMRADAEAELVRLLEFLGTPAPRALVQDAVEYASYENMRRIEASGSLRLAGGRMVARDRGNPDSYKVRRGKVGGYREYFRPEELAAMDRMVATRLAPFFGYGPSQAERAAPARDGAPV